MFSILTHSRGERKRSDERKVKRRQWWEFCRHLQTERGLHTAARRLWLALFLHPASSKSLSNFRFRFSSNSAPETHSHTSLRLPRPLSQRCPCGRREFRLRACHTVAEQNEWEREKVNGSVFWLAVVFACRSLWSSGRRWTTRTGWRD